MRVGAAFLSSFYCLGRVFGLKIKTVTFENDISEKEKAEATWEEGNNGYRWCLVVLT